MNLTDNEWVIVAFLCTVSLVIGWLSGRHEKQVDQDIFSGESWAQHWASVMWVVRRPSPDLDNTVPNNDRPQSAGK